MTSLDHRNDVSHEEAAVSGEVRRWRAFALLAAGFFMTVLDLTITNVALPIIGRKLHFPESDLQVVPESRLHGARRRSDPPGAVTVTGALVVPAHGHFWANLAGPLFLTGCSPALLFRPPGRGEPHRRPACTTREEPAPPHEKKRRSSS